MQLLRILAEQQVGTQVLDPSSMTYEQVYDKLREVRSMLDEMVSDYFQLHCAAARFEGECLPDQVHLTEVLTVCAWQSFNDQGQRCGDVRLILRDGSMPLYVARGMLESAKQYVNKIATCDCNRDEDDDGCS